MTNLPNEIVSLIISQVTEKHHLYECALVSKQCHAIANPLLWENPVLIDTDISTRFLRCVSIAQQPIRSLHLNGPFWTDDRLMAVLRHLTTCLDSLILQAGTLITDASFQHVPALSSLTLVSTQLSQTSFEVLARQNNLTSLHWYIHQPQDPQWLALLPSLRRLHIYSQDEPLSAGLVSHLHTLPLTWLRIDHSVAQVMPVLLQGGRWPDLTHLDLKPCDTMDDATLIRFLHNHPALKTIQLYDAKILTDRCLDAMDHLTGLTITKNTNITAHGIRRLILRCSSLQHVQLHFCRHITPQQFPEWHGHSMLAINLDQHAIDMIKQQGA